MTKYTAFCIEHDLPLTNGRCDKCRDSNGNTFVLDMQSYYLVPRRIEMTIEATVVGLRLWPRSTSKRVLDIEWEEPKTTDAEHPFQQTLRMQVTDNDEEFDLGDVVKLELSFVRRVESE